MSIQITSLSFSANADKSANDYTAYLRPTRDGNWILAVTYKNAERSDLHEMELDIDDVEAFGRLLVAFAGAHREDSQCPPRSR